MVHELEIFGPVATVVPYRDKADAFVLARRGGGSLAASVFSGDTAVSQPRQPLRWGRPTAAYCWSIPRLATVTPGTASCLPSLMHGGPGRAGGGEELGGLHGLWFYHQRVAVQGSTTTVSPLVAQAAYASME